MSEPERREFDKELSEHTAPALTGIKCANLFTVDKPEQLIGELCEEFSGRAGRFGLDMKVLCRCGRRTLIYIYHRDILEAWLSRPDVKELLSEYGYSSDDSTEHKLKRLSSRIRFGNFPHEIGAFLGYPVDDVRGFINNKGRNCLLCGTWKVYHEAEKAKLLFKKYGECREYLCSQIKQGTELFAAVQQYKEEFQ
ncbi:DUF3793 family protein [Ruminococcus sp. HUN007]|uniref:DUF3793 family protein n=1 Tax=Ruminococcus sp. HUN007 TaxID=1514668 RepID=UPI0005D29702|nr:DUF3793 family protein [Ruminococcus sp. HUN007]